MADLRGPLFEGLPAPGLGKLTLYVMGPGFGESVVLAMPDGAWIVVDSCRHGSAVLPEELLRAAGAARIDLLVLSHPDLDHVDGADRLLLEFDVTELWRYPAGSMVRDFLARELRKFRNDDPRLRALFETLDAIEEKVRSGLEVYDGRSRQPVFVATDDSYRMVCIAPTTFDAQRASKQFGALLRLEPGRVPGLSDRLLAYLVGDRAWSDRPNTVSLALSIDWGACGVLLAGDVENGTDVRYSGWSGVLDRLAPRGALPDATYLVRRRALVKVAHHGSDGALWADAWTHHSSGGTIPIAVVTPFERGSANPPHVGAMSHLKGHVHRLLLTSPRGHCEERLADSGWIADSVEHAPGAAPAVAVVLGPDRVERVVVSGEAGAFVTAT